MTPEEIARKVIDEWWETASSPREAIASAIRAERERAEKAEAERDRLREVLEWMDTWVSNPASAYSVFALDGLFGMSRDRISEALARVKGESHG